MRGMKKIWGLILLFILAVGVAARDDKKADTSKPDFSGKWVLDKSKSELGRIGQGPMANAEVTLLIEHKEPELKILRTILLNGQEIKQAFLYFSDNRGETNPAAFGNAEVKSKTKWDKAKLESKSSASFSVRGETFYADTSEKRELSAEGKVLTISISISSSRGLQLIKQVFNRVES